MGIVILPALDSVAKGEIAYNVSQAVAENVTKRMEAGHRWCFFPAEISSFFHEDTRWCPPPVINGL